MRSRMQPLKTHAFDPGRLPVVPYYDPKKHLTGTPDHDTIEGRTLRRSKFETLKEARREDRHRSKALLKSDRPDAQQLGEWLKEATDAKELPLSLVSATYMRAVRRAMTSNLASHFAMAFPGQSATPFTVASPNWRFTTQQLKKTSPRQIKATFRNMLVTSGVEAADGVLIAGLHGEYDGEAFQLHFHGCAIGEKAEALKGLRRNARLKTCEAVYRPLELGVAISVGDTSRLLGWLTYCFQSFWPHRPHYIDAKGHRRRVRQKRRLPRRTEVLVLTWLARAAFGDCRLVNGWKP